MPVAQPGAPKCPPFASLCECNKNHYYYSWSGNRQPVLRHARGVSAQSQSSVCVAVTPGGNRGPPLWFTALLLRVLEAFECYSQSALG